MNQLQTKGAETGMIPMLDKGKGKRDSDIFYLERLLCARRYQLGTLEDLLEGIDYDDKFLQTMSGFMDDLADNAKRVREEKKEEEKRGKPRTLNPEP